MKSKVNLIEFGNEIQYHYRKNGNTENRFEQKK